MSFEIGDAKVSLTVDMSGLARGLKEAETRTAYSTKNATEKVTQIWKSTGEVITRTITTSLDKQGKAVQHVATSHRTLTAAVEREAAKQAAAMEKAAQKQIQANDKAAQAEFKRLAANQQVLQKAGQQAEAARQKEQQAIQRALSRWETAYLNTIKKNEAARERASAKAVADAEKAAAKEAAAMAKAGEDGGKGLAAGIAAGAAQAVRSIQSIGTGITEIGRSVAAFGAVLTGVGYAGKRAFESIIAPTADIESSMTMLGAMSGELEYKVGGVTDKMREMANELGTSTKFSIQEVTGVMIDLAQKGFEPAKMKADQIRPLLDLAAASMESVSTASEAVTATLNTFGLSFKESGKVADIFAATAVKTAGTLSYLNTALNYIGPVAAESGVSIEEMSAALGTVADRGVRATTAGTSLRHIIANLLDPTAGLKQEMEKLGLTQADLDIRSKGLAGVLKTLRDAGIDAGGAFNAFDKTAAPVALALLDIDGKGGGALRQMQNLTKELKNSAGAAHDIAAPQMQTLAGMWDRLKDSLTVVAVSIGNAMTPAIKSLIGWVTELVNQLGEWVEKNKKLIASIAQGIVASLANWIETGVNWVKNNKDMLLGMAETIIKFVAFGGLIGPLIVAVGGFLYSLGQMTVGLATLISFFNPANVVIGAMLVAVWKLGGGWEGWKNKVVFAIAAVKVAWQELSEKWALISGGWTGDLVGFESVLTQSEQGWANWGASLKVTWDNVKLWFSDTWIFLKNTFNYYVEEYKKITGQWEVDLGRPLTIGEKLKAGLATIFNTIKTAVYEAIGAAWEFVIMVFDNIYDKVSLAMENMYNDVAKYFRNVRETAMLELGNFASQMTQWANNVLPGIVDNIMGKLGPLGGAIAGAAGGFVAGGVPGAVGGAVAGAFASGVDSAPGGWSWVGEQGPELMYVPRGASITPAAQSAKQAGGVTINVSNMQVRSDQDIPRIAQELYNLQRRDSRSRGY